MDLEIKDVPLDSFTQTYQALLPRIQEICDQFTITCLQYGRKKRAIIRHFDGHQTDVDIGTIEEFISEAGNPANQKNVEVVDLEHPSLEKYAGLRLVDTPGLGSIFKYHMETSENWLPEVGTALLAISSDRPLSDIRFSFPSLPNDR